MIEWYVLHVHMDRETKIAEILKKKLPAALYRPFVPEKESVFVRAGIAKIEKHICFPGYVFIESNTSAHEFIEKAGPVIRAMKEIHSTLSYDGKNDIALAEDEVAVFKKLLNKNDCIEVSRGNIVNGIAQVESGPLVGMEESIRRIRRPKKSAEIEILFRGEPRRINVGLEIISKS